MIFSGDPGILAEGKQGASGDGSPAGSSFGFITGWLAKALTWVGAVFSLAGGLLLKAFGKLKSAFGKVKDKLASFFKKPPLQLLPGINVQNFGGSAGGQAIGVVSLGQNNALGIVTATRGAGGIAHNQLSTAAFGALQVGQFRFGFTNVGGVNVFQQLSTRMIPTLNQLGAVRQALNAAGLTGPAQVIMNGKLIPF
jgi:hypothetical protein